MEWWQLDWWSCLSSMRRLQLQELVIDLKASWMNEKLHRHSSWSSGYHWSLWAHSATFWFCFACSFMAQWKNGGNDKHMMVSLLQPGNKKKNNTHQRGRRRVFPLKSLTFKILSGSALSKILHAALLKWKPGLFLSLLVLDCRIYIH